jgi:DNA-binding XRE family transcriptional regulator
MATTLDSRMAKLKPARRRKIEARAAELIAQEMSLRELRKAHELTQEQVAEILEVGQDGVSRLEKRGDLLVSTLRSYVEAMGGRLSLIAEFPNRKPIRLAAHAAMVPKSVAGIRDHRTPTR